MNAIIQNNILNSDEELEKKLEQAFSDFEKGQRYLKHQLTTNPEKCLDELKHWTERRQRQCAVIQFLLEHLREEIEQQIRPVETAKLWQKRLANLIAEESKLYELLLTVKNNIKKQMLEINKNKKALSGYRLHKKDPYYISTEA